MSLLLRYRIVERNVRVTLCHSHVYAASNRENQRDQELAIKG